MALFDAWLFCKAHAAKWTTIFSNPMVQITRSTIEIEGEKEKKRNWSDEPRSEHLVAIVLDHLG